MSPWFISISLVTPFATLLLPFYPAKLPVFRIKSKLCPVRVIPTCFCGIFYRLLFESTTRSFFTRTCNEKCRKKWKDGMITYDVSIMFSSIFSFLYCEYLIKINIQSVPVIEKIKRDKMVKENSEVISSLQVPRKFMMKIQSMYLPQVQNLTILHLLKKQITNSMNMMENPKNVIYL